MMSRMFSMEQEKTLRVLIETPFRGPGGLPAIYATPEAQGVIKGHVEFEAGGDLTGKSLELAFRTKSEARWLRHYGESTVEYHSKDVLQKQAWEIPISHVRPGVITPGRTRFDFDVVLNPHTPNSIRGKRAWITYRFTATLRRPFPKRNIVFKQDVWTFSSCIPAPGAAEKIPPHILEGLWEDRLPFTLSIPNFNVMLGQSLPVTIKFDPFVETSGHRGQELIVADAVVKLKQYTRLWHRWDVKTEKKEVLEIPFNEDWPQGTQGFERTLYIDIPEGPRLSSTTYTKPVRKTHKLKLIMHVHTNVHTSKAARELRIEMDINVTGPRPPVEGPETREDLPPYSAAWVSGGDEDD